MDISKWSFRKIPRTLYHNLIVEGHQPPLEAFMESFVIDNLHLPYRDLYGVEMLTYFHRWKVETNHTFDENLSEGMLVKRILTELKLPEDAITKLGRGKKGKKRRYDIELLKKALDINEKELLDYVVPKK